MPDRVVNSPAAPAHLRAARPGDADAIAALIGRNVPSGKLLPRTPEFIAQRSSDFIVATVDNRVVGCVHVEEYSPSLAEVRSLAVDPAHQTRGIGVALVRAAEQLARMRGYETMFAVSNNDAFFTARGYRAAEIPELDKDRSEVSRFKGVYAKRIG